ADDEVVVGVERQTERVATDAGEDLRVLEVLPGEPHDPALPGAAVEPSLLVEDDVPGAFHLADTDAFRANQPVVHLERAAGTRAADGQVDVLHEGPVDVALLHRLDAVLAPLHVAA